MAYIDELLKDNKVFVVDYLYDGDPRTRAIIAESMEDAEWQFKDNLFTEVIAICEGTKEDYFKYR